MIRKDYLCINGGYDFRIEFLDNGKKNYYITKGPYTWEHLERVSKEEFIEDLREYKWILTGWNKELRQEYIDLLKQEGVD